MATSKLLPLVPKKPSPGWRRLSRKVLVARESTKCRHSGACRQGICRGLSRSRANAAAASEFTRPAFRTGGARLDSGHVARAAYGQALDDSAPVAQVDRAAVS